MNEFDGNLIDWENAASAHFRNACENVSTLEEAKIYTGEKPELMDNFDDDSNSSDAEVPDEGEEDEMSKTYAKDSNANLEEGEADRASKT